MGEDDNSNNDDNLSKDINDLHLEFNSNMNDDSAVNHPKSLKDYDLDNIMGDDSFDFRNGQTSKKKLSKQWNELREKIKSDDYCSDSKIDRLGQNIHMANMELNLNKDGTIKLDEKINKMIDDEFDKLASSDFLNELKELEKSKGNMATQLSAKNDIPNISNAVLTQMSFDEFDNK